MKLAPRTLIPILLWTLVLVVGGIVYVQRARLAQQTPELPATDLETDGVRTEVKPWKYFTDIDRFTMTDQTGKTFDTQTMPRKPMIVSFFFAKCPSICRNLNNEIHRLNQAIKDVDVQFVTITVDPEHDDVEVLNEYAAGYDATPDRWAFLTGSRSQLVAVGENQFNVAIAPGTHEDDILLVDKWGRFRDRFKWSNPLDTKRFLKVIREVASETEPPLEESFATRNILAGEENPNLHAIPWLHDFHLRLADDSKFFSRELTGQVWLAHLAGSATQPSAELLEGWNRLNQEVEARAIPLVGIARETEADNDELPAGVRWGVVTDADRFGRIAREVFGIDLSSVVGSGQESTVSLVGRWGNAHGRFDLSDAESRQQLRQAIVDLRSQNVPPPPTFGFDHLEHPNE